MWLWATELSYDRGEAKPSIQKRHSVKPITHLEIVNLCLSSPNSNASINVMPERGGGGGDHGIGWGLGSETKIWSQTS